MLVVYALWPTSNVDVFSGVSLLQSFFLQAPLFNWLIINYFLTKTGSFMTACSNQWTSQSLRKATQGNQLHPKIVPHAHDTPVWIPELNPHPTPFLNDTQGPQWERVRLERLVAEMERDRQLLEDRFVGGGSPHTKVPHGGWDWAGFFWKCVFHFFLQGFFLWGKVYCVYKFLIIHPHPLPPHPLIPLTDSPISVIRLCRHSY